MVWVANIRPHKHADPGQMRRLMIRLRIFMGVHTLTEAFPINIFSGERLQSEWLPSLLLFGVSKTRNFFREEKCSDKRASNSKWFYEKDKTEKPGNNKPLMRVNWPGDAYFKRGFSDKYFLRSNSGKWTIDLFIHTLLFVLLVMWALNDAKKRQWILLDKLLVEIISFFCLRQIMSVCHEN